MLGIVEAGPDGELRFPTRMMSATYVGAGAIPGVVTLNVADSDALIAWLHKDAVIAALNREIEQLSDDKNALSDQERAARTQTVLADMLLAEREE